MKFLKAILFFWGLILITVVSLLTSVLFYRYLSLDIFFSNIEYFTNYIEKLGIISILVYFFIYVFVVTFSLPAASILSIIGGYLFGTFLGGVLAFLSALSGASILFLMVKAGFRNTVTNKLGNYPAFSNVEFGIIQNQYRYLFFMRFMPIFPFWVVNLAPAVLGISFKVFFITTSLGILPGTFIIAAIGDKLRYISNPDSDLVYGLIQDPSFIFPFVVFSIMIVSPIVWRFFR